MFEMSAAMKTGSLRKEAHSQAVLFMVSFGYIIIYSETNNRKCSTTCWPNLTVFFFFVVFFHFHDRDTNLFCHIYIFLSVLSKRTKWTLILFLTSWENLRFFVEIIPLLQFSSVGYTDSSGARRRRRIYSTSWIHLRIFLATSPYPFSSCFCSDAFVLRRCKYLDLNLIYSYTQNVIHLRYLYVADAPIYCSHQPWIYFSILFFLRIFKLANLSFW